MPKTTTKSLIRSPVFVAMAAVGVMLASGSAFAPGNAANSGKLTNQWLNSCHSVGAGENARKPDEGPQFAELTKKTLAYLATAINKPHDFMAKFPDLSKQDKEDIIAYIRTVK